MGPFLFQDWLGRWLQSLQGVSGGFRQPQSLHSFCVIVVSCAKSYLYQEKVVL